MDYDGKIGVGSELDVGLSQLREHRRPPEFPNPWVVVSFGVHRLTV